MQRHRQARAPVSPQLKKQFRRLRRDISVNLFDIVLLRKGISRSHTTDGSRRFVPRGNRFCLLPDFTEQRWHGGGGGATVPLARKEAKTDVKTLEARSLDAKNHQ